MSKNNKTEEKLYKCPHCKKKSVSFHFHVCNESHQEYFGCKFCDDWCIKCRKDWNNYNETK